MNNNDLPTKEIEIPAKKSLNDEDDHEFDGLDVNKLGAKLIKAQLMNEQVSKLLPSSIYTCHFYKSRL